ncbi:hypothetical protein ACHAWX_005868 [Stephanocyclus meneghinianus]
MQTYVQSMPRGSQSYQKDMQLLLGIRGESHFMNSCVGK